jgi:hypothetical protein
MLGGTIHVNIGTSSTLLPLIREGKIRAIAQWGKSREADLPDRLDSVLAGLNDGKGTAGQLLHDRQLYDNLNGAVTELRGLLADIRKDPQKYLRVKVSIF